MKKCPTCDKTFDDSMKFCQVDGTALVDDAPAFDPYATMVGQPRDITAAEEASKETAFEPQPEEPPAIAAPDNILDLPEADPLKTMYVSESELKEVMGGSEAPADEPPAPEPPSFSVPDVPAPSFGDATPPPSPFSTPDEPVSAPSAFDEPPTVMQSTPFEPSTPAPAAEWTPPPAPDAVWQNKEIGSNTPFQPPATGIEGESKGLTLGSLICGILSCTICCGLGLIVGPAAIVMGFIAKKKAQENPSQFGGNGMALGGMITGGVGLLLGILIIALQLLGVLANLGR